jgi:hypothetical protein
MATIGNSFYNLIDYYRSLAGNGESIEADVVEALATLKPAIGDAIATEANKGASHLHTIRSGLPTVTWGRLYRGIQQSKGSKTQVEDTTGFVEGRSEIDERLLQLTNNEAAVRMDEANGFLEALGQEVESGIFYNDTASTPEKFKGLAARYNTLGGGGAGNQVVNALGAGSDNTSIWFVTWGESQTTLIYPKGTKAGIERTDRGSQQVLDAGGLPYFAKVEEFRWHLGLAVRDWRYNARIANIDLSDVQAGTVDLYKYMRKAYYKLQGRRCTKMFKGNGQPNPHAAREGRTVIYMNRDMLEALDALATNKGNTDSYVRLTPMELEGKEVMSYRGIPIRETDALLNTETVVS